MILHRTCLALLAALLLGACGAPDTPGKPPNLLFLVMDTARADRLSVTGYDRPTSPGLEALARESVLFTDAWSSSSWTGPSHATLFTGLRPENHGFLVGNRQYLETSATTLAERLSGAGYRTACFTCNPMISSQFGLTQGFGTYALHENPEEAEEPSPDPDSRWAHRRALDFARESRRMGRPWFVFVNDWEPHLTYDPPPEPSARFVSPEYDPARVERARGFQASVRVLFGLGWRGIDATGWRVLSDLYDAELATLDAEIATFVENLRTEGLLENTILVVTADHGENLGNHGLCAHSFSVHRTLLHVPLIIRDPVRFEAGRVVDEVVRLEDLFPTILERCGLPVPEDIDGESLAGDLSGRIARAALGRPNVAAVAMDYPQFVRSGYAVSLRSVYDGRHHLILASDGRVELYDVKADPLETRNLAGSEPEKIEELIRRIGGPLPEDADVRELREGTFSPGDADFR